MAATVVYSDMNTDDWRDWDKRIRYQERLLLYDLDGMMWGIGPHRKRPQPPLLSYERRFDPRRLP